MTHNEIVDRITSNVQSGIKTDDTRFTRDFVASHVNSARATAIQQAWMRYRKINPQWLQPFDLVYDKDLQGDLYETQCITKYNVPSWISLDGKSDGMVFIGNLQNRAFRIFNSRGELANYLNIPSQSPYSGRYVGVLRDNGFIELHYSNAIKTGTMLLLYNNPSDCPTYNIEVDQYPATEELINLIEDIVYKKFLTMAQMPIDMVSNKNDNRVAQLQPIKQQN